MSDKHELRPYHHQKNITVGRGRILYDSTGGIQGGKWVSPGWVIPGGARTNDYETAYRAAEFIDAQSRRRSGVGVIG